MSAIDSKMNTSRGTKMREITRDLTIETNSGKIVTVSVTVEGTYDSHYRADADGNRGSRVWHISDINFEVPDCDDSFCPLSQDDKNEIEKLVSERIGEESWNFDSI